VPSRLGELISEVVRIADCDIPTDGDTDIVLSGENDGNTVDETLAISDEEKRDDGVSEEVFELNGDSDIVTDKAAEFDISAEGDAEKVMTDVSVVKGLIDVVLIDVEVAINVAEIESDKETTEEGEIVNVSAAENVSIGELEPDEEIFADSDNRDVSDAVTANDLLAMGDDDIDTVLEARFDCDGELDCTLDTEINRDSVAQPEVEPLTETLALTEGFVV
jgi:hypothetical protein